MSGGEKQRLVLARAMYSDADILLLDEPLSAVDTLTRKELFDNCLKKACQEGRTVLFNTHQLEVGGVFGGMWCGMVWCGVCVVWCGVCVLWCGVVLVKLTF